MKYRYLGRSGLLVSRICLGTMTFGGGGKFANVGTTDVDGARRQVDRCLDAGVNLIDTADVYSAGVSEQMVGRWLAHRDARVELPLTHDYAAAERRLRQLWSQTPVGMTNVAAGIGRAATERDGAASLLVGLAGNASLASGNPVRVADLLDITAYEEPDVHRP